MTWDGSDTIALIELIFYSPFLLLSTFVCCRHGFRRSSGWFFIHILCLIRIIGGICQFVSDSNPSAGLLQTVLILESVGLTPLLLSTLGLISRFSNFINASSTPEFKVLHFRILQVPLIVGTILAVVGGTSVSVDPNGTYQLPTISKAAVILYIIGFTGMLLVFILSLPRTPKVPDKERRVPVAVGLATPFILVRLIYSILSTLVQNHLFNIATGSTAVRLSMAVIMELVVVAMYVLLGMSVDKMDASKKGTIANRPWDVKRSSKKRRATHTGSIDSEAQHLETYPAPQTQGILR